MSMMQSVLCYKIYIRVKKILRNIQLFPLDNASLHFEENVAKWVFVYHRRLTPKVDLSIDAHKCSNIMELLRGAQLLKIMIYVGLYHPKHVKEFR